MSPDPRNDAERDDESTADEAAPAAERMTATPRRNRARSGRSFVVYLDIALWSLVLVLIGWRFGPQLLAATGAGDTAVPAPPFEVSTFDGDTISLAGLRGNVVLVNFWATWCPPCRLEIPALERVWRDRRADGLVILGLSMDYTGEQSVRNWARERGITYPTALASDRVASDFGGIHALPTSFLIDRSGRIRYRVTGYFAEPALRAAVGRLLDE